MSCHVASDIEIWTIATLSHLPKYTGVTTEPAYVTTVVQLAADMLVMNEQAYAMCYPHTVLESPPITNDAAYGRFCRRPLVGLPPPTPAAMVKLLDHFLYQCNEGEIDQWVLYKSLKVRVEQIARYALGDAYEKAPWGLP